MPADGTIEEIDARRILDVLSDQRRQVAALHDAVSAASALAARSAESLDWLAPSRRAFAGRLAEVIDKFDRGANHLAEAIDECDRAAQEVRQRTVATADSRVGMVPT